MTSGDSFSVRILTSRVISLSVIVHDCFVKCANDITYAALFDLFSLVCTVIKSILYYRAIQIILNVKYCFCNIGVCNILR